MNLLKAPQAPVQARMPYGDVEYGFMRNRWGEISFLASHGNATISFPVFEDGTISPYGDFGTWPETVVELIHPRDLGITELKYRAHPTIP